MRANPLDLVLRATKLSVGLTKTAIEWQLDISNPGDGHVVALRIWSEPGTAHGIGGGREQLARPMGEDAGLHTIASLFPGARGRIEGEWRLHHRDAKPVGDATPALLVPLARFRFVGAGIAPFRRAFLIGLPPAGPGQKIRPVRLDHGQQVHTRLAVRPVG